MSQIPQRRTRPPQQVSCPHCGTANERGARNCRQCDCMMKVRPKAAIAADYYDDPPQVARSVDRTRGAGCLIALAILGVVAFAMYAIGTNNRGSPALEQTTAYATTIFPTATSEVVGIKVADSVAPPTQPPVEAFAPEPTSTTEPLPTEPPPTQPPPPPVEQVLSFKGATGQNTPPFDLAGGTYEAKWAAKLNSSSCLFLINMVSTKDASDTTKIASSVIQEGSPMADSTFLYNVVGGQYYIAVTESGCSWEVTLTPK